MDLSAPPDEADDLLAQEEVAGLGGGGHLEPYTTAGSGMPVPAAHTTMDIGPPRWSRAQSLESYGHVEEPPARPPQRQYFGGRGRGRHRGRRGRGAAAAAAAAAARQARLEARAAAEAAGGGAVDGLALLAGSSATHGIAHQKLVEQHAEQVGGCYDEQVVRGI
jgi:hypothetical protein